MGQWATLNLKLSELCLQPTRLAWHPMHMPKRIKQPKRPRDVNKLARYLVDLSTLGKESSIEPPTKAQVSMLMAELGRRGGKIGGKRRLETMSARERVRIARKAAEARWNKS